MSGETLVGRPPNTIALRGARVHNLKNVNLDLPRDRLVVLTGVSGSGKSSLAFDTLFAEGRRRYFESLSGPARVWLNSLERPDLDALEGLPPTLSIQQRIAAAHPRSTLATTTEIHDFLRVLYARAGTPHCVACGRPIVQHSPRAIVEQTLALPPGQRIMILAPLARGQVGSHAALFDKICRDGFVRARIDGVIADAAAPPDLNPQQPHDIEVVIDRLAVKEGIRPRLHESVELALKQGNAVCVVSQEEAGEWRDLRFSSRFVCAACGLSYPDVEPRTFSFNSPAGACPTCGGLGSLNRPGDTAPGNDPCPDCRGDRLGPFARTVTICGTAIQQFTALTVTGSLKELQRWQREFAPDDADPSTAASRQVAARLLPKIARRLEFLEKVGLEYLTLNRPTNTLSGGEFQRARLAGCLGAALVGVCYILDEPTIGLHPRDTNRMLAAIRELRDQGNSVIVVEHDLDVIQAADFLVELGPGAGCGGGDIVAWGTVAEVRANPNSVTGRYLNRVVRPVDAANELIGDGTSRWLTLARVSARNLKNLSVRIPLGALTCVTGVSGSGKSSLVMETLVPRVRAAIAARAAPARESSAAALPRGDGSLTAVLTGDEPLERLVEVDQSPIGRNGRSNPATTSGIWDEIRRLFARTKAARLRGYRAARFSFNSAGGRCESCHGCGTRRLAMRLLPDMHVVCSTCRGQRFNRPTLQVRFRGKSVADMLNMRFDEAAAFFENFLDLRARLQAFLDVGLEYLLLGQSAQTLSGGEAQRVKLAGELGRPGTGRTLFVLDEPTTGLHAADVERLLTLLRQLIAAGHTVLVVEHNLELIAATDWVIDLGPDGGAAGGAVVATGTPRQIAQVAASHTGQALRRRFEARG